MKKRMIIICASILFLLFPIKEAYATEIDGTKQSEELEREPLGQKTITEEEYNEVVEKLYGPPDNKEKRDAGIEIQDGNNDDVDEVTIKKGNGYLTLVAHCATSINENIYVKFMDLSSYKYYAYYLYSLNDYKTSVEIPAGNYMIVDGGPLYDTTNQYPVEEKTFQVAKNAATLVEFGVGMEPNRAGVYEEEAPEITINLESTQINEEGEEETVIEYDVGNSEQKEVEEIQSLSGNNIVLPKTKKSNIASLILSLIGFGLLFGVFIWFIYKFKD